MKITEMRVTPVAVYDPPLRNSWGVHQPYQLRTVIQVWADNGLIGLSETYGDQKIIAELEASKGRVVGQDPYLLEPLRAQINNPRIYAAVEVACLDLIGQAQGRPLCDLLGGKVRDTVPFAAYLFYKYQAKDARDTWGEVMTPEAMLGETRRFVTDYGFQSLKVKGGVLPPDQEIETMRLLRAEFPQHKLRIDPNAVWTVETSIRAGRAMESLNLEYLEDPTEGRKGMAQVRKQVKMPLSTNMCVVAFDQIAEGFKLGSVDVILSDHHYWGGMHATKYLGKICEVLGWGVGMHSNTHLGISMAAMVHVAAATPQLTYACDTHYPWQVDDVIQGQPFKFVKGSLPVPDKPGLGVTLDEGKLAQLHEQYRKARLEKRDDTAEMLKYDPTWVAKKGRW